MRAAEVIRRNIEQLGAKRERQKARLAEIEAESRSLAYRAEVVPVRTGDADADANAAAEHSEARNRVRALEDERARLAREAELTGVALADAHATFASPQLAAVDEAERRSAREAKEITAGFAKRGALLDEALACVVREVQEIREAADALHRLGYFGPSVDLVRVNLERAVVGVLAGTGLNLDARHANPASRSTLAGLTEGWAKNVAAKADERLANPKHSAKKAA